MKLHQFKIRKERRRCQGAESPVMTKGRGEITHLFTSEKHRGWRKGPEPEVEEGPRARDNVDQKHGAPGKAKHSLDPSFVQSMNDTAYSSI